MDIAKEQTIIRNLFKEGRVITADLQKGWRMVKIDSKLKNIKNIENLKYIKGCIIW